MTNQKVADELQYAIDLIKQDGKDWLDERDIPILEAAISALQAQEAKHSTESSLTQKELDESKEHGSKLEPKCETCQHNSNEWDEEPCDSCVSGNGRPSGYEPCVDAVSRADIVWQDMLVPDGNGQYHYEKVAYKSQIDDLPSANPDVPDINVGDMISRQAAIDALKNRWKKTRNYEGNGDDIAEECELYLKQLPSAQPDLSGYSSRLWKAAYERGKAEAQAEIVRCKENR